MRPLSPFLLCCVATALTACVPGDPPTAPRLRVAPNAPQLALIVTGITDLGSLGGDFVSVGDINDFGQIVGSTTAASDPARAFIWESGATTPLFAPDMTAFSTAHGVNNLRQVVGEGGLGHSAMLWENGTVTELPRLAFGSSMARAINDHGQIVGFGHNAAGQLRAVLWGSGMPNVVPTDLGTLGGDASFAADINNVGQIVGNSRNAAAKVRPVLWQNGTPTDLNTLGGDRGDAMAINDLGHIVGSSEVAPTVTHATLWKNGTTTDLGTVGGTFSQASDINQLGQIVGVSTDAAGSTHALLWMDGTMYDLGNPPGSNESSAIAINDLGEVVGVTTDTRHFVRWQVAMRATIDVAPADATNALRLGGAGTLSLGVLGSRYFDAAQVDPRTVTLGNEDASDTPVLRKKSGQPEASVRDLNRDGYLDLVLDFDKKQMAANGDLSASTTQLVLVGGRFDGRRVRGIDKVTVK